MLAIALSFMGVAGVSAQSWTSANVSAGYYLLYNVGTGTYLTRANDWNTHASHGAFTTAMTVELIASGDDWRIRTGVNGGDYGLEFVGSPYTDQSRGKSSSWTFTQVGEDNGPIYTIKAAANHQQNIGKYLAADPGNTKLVPSDDSSSPYSQWKIICDDAAAKAALSAANPNNPMDATFLIKDQGFGASSSIAGNFWKVEANNYNPNGGVEAWESNPNPSAESWRSAFHVYQKLTGLPEGTYELKAQAAITDYNNKYDGDNYPVVYANDKSTPFINMVEADRETSMQQLGHSFASGLYEVAALTIEVPENGEITLGVRGTRTDTWCIWDNFRLTFYGFNLEALVADYETQLAQLRSITGAMNADVAQQLSDAIGVDANLDKSDKVAVRAAMAGFETAREAANASIDIYKKIAADIASFKKNFKDGDATAMEEKYANGTYQTYEEFADELQAAKLATLGQEDNTDYTSLIVNPAPYANMDGWETIGTKPNAFDPDNKCAEYWNIPGSRFQQTLKDMPAGVYTMTVIAFTRTEMQSKIGLNGDEQYLVTVPSSEVNWRGTANEWFNAGNGINTVTTTLPHGGDLTLWLQSDNTTGDHWTVWRSFSLSYSKIKDLILVDAGTEKFQATKKQDGKYDEITAIVTGNGNLDGTKDNLKDGIRIVYENTDALNENLYTAGFKAEAEISDNAGTTYFVKAAEKDDVIKLAQGLFGPNNVYNVTLKPIVYYNFDLFYDEIYQTWEAGKDAHMQDKGNGKFVLDPAWTLKACAETWTTNFWAGYGVATSPIAYDYCDALPLWTNGTTYTFTITTDGSVKQDPQALVKTNTVTAFNAWGEDITAELLGIGGGTATGINSVNAAADGSAIYNLAGQRVAKAQKGIYVVNGKKVAVK